MNLIREKLEAKTFDISHGTVDSFMESCEICIKNAKNFLYDAQCAKIL